MIATSTGFVDRATDGLKTGISFVFDSVIAPLIADFGAGYKLHHRHDANRQARIVA